jgi:hypothetical protein
VERLWETLQSRLPIEFKLANITCVEQANIFLLSYIPEFNAKFAVKPDNPIPAFRALSDDLVLDNILCVKEARILDNGLVFSFYNKYFKIVPGSTNTLVYPKSKVMVLVSPKFGIRGQYGENVYDVIPFIKPKKQSKSESEAESKTPYTPPDDHYFKYGHIAWPKLTFEDSDHEILKMLEKIFLSKYA